MSYLVTFGKESVIFHEDRYKLSLSACALEHDLTILSDGDQTEIGEKGITLSGGQKARVGMARAVYHDADIYLLDDPLAAVDAHVGKHLFQECIINELLLDNSSTSRNEKRSSVILVTNAIQYLSDPNVDKILVFDNGAIVEAGTYEELSTNKDSLFSTYLSVVLETSVLSRVSEKSSEEMEEESSVWNDSLSQFSPLKFKQGIVDEACVSTRSKGEVDVSIPLTPKVKEAQPPKPQKKNETISSATPLVTNELLEREKGHVTLDVYLSWARAAGGVVVGITILIAYVIDQSVRVGSNWWLTYWSRNGNDSSGAALDFLFVYAMINLTAVFTMFGRVILIMLSGLRASRKLFTELLDVVLRAPMSFFDSKCIPLIFILGFRSV